MYGEMFYGPHTAQRLLLWSLNNGSFGNTASKTYFPDQSAESKDFIIFEMNRISGDCCEGSLLTITGFMRAISWENLF